MLQKEPRPPKDSEGPFCVWHPWPLVEMLMGPALGFHDCFLFSELVLSRFLSLPILLEVSSAQNPHPHPVYVLGAQEGAWASLKASPLQCGVRLGGCEVLGTEAVLLS